MFLSGERGYLYEPWQRAGSLSPTLLCAGIVRCREACSVIREERERETDSSLATPVPCQAPFQDSTSYPSIRPFSRIVSYHAFKPHLLHPLPRRPREFGLDRSLLVVILKIVHSTIGSPLSRCVRSCRCRCRRGWLFTRNRCKRSMRGPRDGCIQRAE